MKRLLLVLLSSACTLATPATPVPRATDTPAPVATTPVTATPDHFIGRGRLVAS